MKHSRELFSLFRLILEAEFRLKNRVNFRQRDRILFDGAECFGDYWGEPLDSGGFQHKIRVATSEVHTPEALFATLAHEYVHAWQMETGRELDHDLASGFAGWQEHFQRHYGIDILG